MCNHHFKGRPHRLEEAKTGAACLDARSMRRFKGRQCVAM
jgi:hypothetical protein